MTERKDLGEVSRGKQDISSRLLFLAAIYTKQPSIPSRLPLLDISPVFHVRPLRGLSTLLALYPQVARCREVLLRFDLPSPRRPGVIQGVTPPGSVLTPLLVPYVAWCREVSPRF